MSSLFSFDSPLWDEWAPQSPANHPAQAAAAVRYVYDDETLLVVDKPAGMPVQADKTKDLNLLERLKQLFPQTPLYLVHRLDRPVSGLVVLAKTVQAQTELTRQMSRHEFTKTYRAVVSPIPHHQSGVLENWLVKNQTANISRVVGPYHPAQSKKLARLSYRVRDTRVVNGREMALLDVTLETGRHHQIRVQLAHAGWPILNDAKYGGLMLENSPGHLALQACQIYLTHPVTHRQMAFHSPMPQEDPWEFFAIHMDIVSEVLGVDENL